MAALAGIVVLVVVAALLVHAAAADRGVALPGRRIARGAAAGGLGAFHLCPFARLGDRLLALDIAQELLVRLLSLARILVRHGFLSAAVVREDNAGRPALVRKRPRRAGSGHLRRRAAFREKLQSGGVHAIALAG